MKFSCVELLERRSLMSSSLVSDFGGPTPHESVTLPSGLTFFMANDGKHGDQLWVSDNTIAGTHQVMVGSGQIGLGQVSMVAWQHGVAFAWSDGLWISDGTAAGTKRIDYLRHSNTPVQHSLIATSDHLLFVTEPGSTPWKDPSLWSSTGAVGNLVMIDRIGAEQAFDFDHDAPTVVNDHAIYSTHVNGGTEEIISSDGTAAGTVVLGGGGVRPVGRVGNDRFEFWQPEVGLVATDGTVAGTVTVMDHSAAELGLYGFASINDINKYFGLPPIENGVYYFTGEQTDNHDGTWTTTMWQSDGTAAGTHAIFSFPNFAEFGGIGAAGGKAIFLGFTTRSISADAVDAHYTLYAFDPQSQQLSTLHSFSDSGVVEAVKNVGNYTYFTMWMDGTSSATYYRGQDNHVALWRTDGTIAGTQLVQMSKYLPTMTVVDDNLGLSSDYWLDDIGTLLTPDAPDTVRTATQNAVSLVDGVLRVFGTDAADNVRVYQLDADPSRLVVNLNGVKHSFAMNLISRVKIYGNGGDDAIAIVESHGKLGFRTNIDGGDGDDTIYTGGGRDTIDGGNGADTINAGNNDDDIDGGTGSDSIVAGNGNDTADGGDGADFVLGNKGNDQIAGGNDGSADTLDGSDGADVLFGQAAIDVFFNGTGKVDPNDTILN